MALAMMSINAWTDAIMTKLFHRQPRSCRTAPEPELESPAQVRSSRTPLPVFRVRPSKNHQIWSLAGGFKRPPNMSHKFRVVGNVMIGRKECDEGLRIRRSNF